jgi:hypothetical protein
VTQRTPHLRVGWLVSFAAVVKSPKLWAQGVESARAGVPLVLDSGAFSVATTGSPVSLLSYTNWLRAGEKWRIADWCASLDVVGDPETTYRNYASMVAAGIENAVPTIHIGAPPEWVDRYADLGTRRVAIGGITAQLRRLRGYTDDDVHRWLAEVMPRCQRAGMATHGFGINAQKLVRGYGWDSVDATSFASGTRYRSIPVYRGGTLRNVSLNDLRLEHVHHLQRIGINTSVMANAFVVGANGGAQWGELLRAGLMGVSAAIHDWNPELRTLYVSDWTMGHHVLPMMAEWQRKPGQFTDMVHRHRHP